MSAFSAADAHFLRRVAEMAALAVENVLAQEALHEEKVRLRALVEVNSTLVSSLEMQTGFSP